MPSTLNEENSVATEAQDIKQNDSVHRGSKYSPVNEGWRTRAVALVLLILVALVGGYAWSRYQQEKAREANRNSFVRLESPVKYPFVEISAPRSKSTVDSKYIASLPSQWVLLNTQNVAEGYLFVGDVYFDSSKYTSEQVLSFINEKRDLYSTSGVVIIEEDLTARFNDPFSIPEENIVFQDEVSGSKVLVVDDKKGTLVAMVTHNKRGVRIQGYYGNEEEKQILVSFMKDIRLQTPLSFRDLADYAEWIFPPVEVARAECNRSITYLPGLKSCGGNTYIDDRPDNCSDSFESCQRAKALWGIAESMSVSVEGHVCGVRDTYTWQIFHLMRQNAYHNDCSGQAFGAYNSFSEMTRGLVKSVGVKLQVASCQSNGSEICLGYDLAFLPRNSSSFVACSFFPVHYYDENGAECRPEQWLIYRCDYESYEDLHNLRDSSTAYEGTVSSNFSSQNPEDEYVFYNRTSRTDLYSSRGEEMGICTGDSLRDYVSCEALDQCDDGSTPDVEIESPTPFDSCSVNLTACEGGDATACSNYWSSCQHTCEAAAASCDKGVTDACTYQTNECGTVVDRTISLSVTGTVFKDRNGDGSQADNANPDIDEPGIPGVKLTVSGLQGTPEATVFTDANGDYIYNAQLVIPLTDTAERCVIITETLPAGIGWQFTIPSDGRRQVCFPVNSLVNGANVNLNSGTDFGNTTLLVELRSDPLGPVTGDTPTTLTAYVTGEARGTINYKFWWDCKAGVDKAAAQVNMSLAEAKSLCGEPATPYGIAKDNQGNNPGTGYETSDTTHIFSLDGAASPKEFHPFVLVERSSNTTPAISGLTIQRTTDAITAISGRVFIDRDGAGDYDLTIDEGLPNVVVTIQDQAGIMSPVTAQTDPFGVYTVSLDLGVRTDMNYIATISPPGSFDCTLPVSNAAGNCAHAVETIHRGETKTKDFGVSTLSVSLTADPVTGTANIPTKLTALVGGEANGTINYYLWWNCNTSTLPTALPANISLSEVTATCGAPDVTPNPADDTANTNTNPHEFNPVYANPGTYTPVVLVERASNLIPAVASAALTRSAPTGTYSLTINPQSDTGSQAKATLSANITGTVGPCQVSQNPATGTSMSSTWDNITVPGKSQEITFNNPDSGTTKSWEFTLTCPQGNTSTTYSLTNNGGGTPGIKTSFCGGD